MMRLHECTFGESEIAAAVAVMETTMVTQGAKVAEFENAFRPGSVACNSGSSANLLAISALKATGRLKDGDEVIIPALCWSTTAFPVIQCGMIPVFVDIDPATLNMDLEQAAAAVTSLVKAIVPISVYGNPVDTLSLQSIHPTNFFIFEDNCEAMGATFCGNPAGTFADISTFSFYFSHHITCMEGGIVCTDDDELRDMLRIQRSHGWTRDVEGYDVEGMDPKFTFVDLGYNLRLTEVQAAIGLVQLPKLAGIVEKRRTAHARLTDVAAQYPWLRLQKEQPGGKSSCFGFTMVMEDDAPFTAQTIRRHLEDNGIETRPIIAGNMALQPVMQKYQHRVVGDLKHATKVMRDGLSIGCHQDVTDNDIDHFAEVMKSVERAAA